MTELSPTAVAARPRALPSPLAWPAAAPAAEEEADEDEVWARMPSSASASGSSKCGSWRQQGGHRGSGHDPR